MWLNGKGQIVNDQKWYNRILHENWDRTDFTTLKLLLATETQASLTFLGGRVGDSFCN